MFHSLSDEKPMSTEERLNPLNFRSPNIQVLHLTWFAFFLTFVVWFSHAPLLSHMQEVFDLSQDQIRALMVLNVALTIPARIVIGTMVDKFGPKRVFSALLIIGGLISIGFSLSQTYTQLAIMRFLSGFIGAGFVIGIRMVGEWFPARQVGVAEGIYGGWGNFGSAAAAMTLPTVALWFGGDDGWRWAIASAGMLAIIYGFVYFFTVSDTPKGSHYFKPKGSGGMEVSNYKDLVFYILLNIPMYVALGILAWRLSPARLDILGQSETYAVYAVLLVTFFMQLRGIWRVNGPRLKEGVPEMMQYKFKQVAILSIAYLVTFGSELAVVSMLPLFFLETFEGMTPVTAGLLASGFAFMNLVSRPTGGHFSDRWGRKRSLLILIAGLFVGYLLMATINSSWPVLIAVAVTMMCSFFVQAGEGAVFAAVPLVQRRLTGQVAGMAGAYGNVGAVCFLLVLSFVSYETFFLTIAGAAFVTWFLVKFVMDEPTGKMAEVMPDGTVTLIDRES